MWELFVIFFGSIDNQNHLLESIKSKQALVLPLAPGEGQLVRDLSVFVIGRTVFDVLAGRRSG